MPLILSSVMIAPVGNTVLEYVYVFACVVLQGSAVQSRLFPW